MTETERAIARLIVREITERLAFLENVGIGYLSLDRSARSLSGGEAQRIRLATQIGSSLVGVMYVLDEPSIGLHQRDNEKLIATLDRLRDLGNTVIVVEHDEGTMLAADHLVDLGPGAGEHGGHVIAAGTPAGGRQEPGLADRPVPLRQAQDRGARGAPRAERARCSSAAPANTTSRTIDVAVPLGVFCCVTGVSGSGKSTLVNETLHHAVANRLHQAKLRPGAHDGIDGLEQIDKIINIDQSPIGRTPRSNPATYTGVFDHIRQLFAQTQEARARGYKPGPLQLQRQGRPLRGLQRRRPDQDRDALPARRLRALRAVPRQALQPRDARGPLQGQEHRRRARDVGRGGGRVLRERAEDRTAACAPCTTSASTTSASASRRRRSPAARRSGSSSRPSSPKSPPATPSTSSTSRPPASTSPTSQRLLEVLGRLVDAGNTVVVIEHNLDVIKTADWLIDLGPEGGEEGGEIVATGTPEEVAAVAGSYTGRFLAELVEPAKPKRGRASARAASPPEPGARPEPSLSARMPLRPW